MLIKSPLKKEKVKENKRNKSAGKRKNRNRTTSFRSNGGNYGKRIKSKDDESKIFSLPTVKPWKVILGAMVMGLLGVVYLNHVFATQELLQEVNQLEREYNQVKRMHSDYKLTYDRMIGPAEIYEKAKSRGFINGGPAEKIIEVQE